ncbi:MAG: gas vesicle protein GvpK [Clostridiales bacterium GWE2_32_10]|nr:MAG: gas vesicle protein GvpK [Bacteroidetes bacterium GWF2_29_10]OGO87168.1 MAG: gas vesicle protein GvpK [Clostridiales bacterium GWE2_32_10]
MKDLDIKEEIEKLQTTKNRLEANKDNVDKGLAQLVLTLIELLRRLMEKQAMNRIENNSLSEQEIEELGLTFMKLDEKMKELMDIFELTEDDLNINLGPLGDLM